jgi:predicted TIM-barrel fold metal-dependent hydrolase
MGESMFRRNGGTDAPVVDSHAHIFLKDMPVTRDAWTRIDYAFSAEDLLAALDAHGVHFGVISGISISGFYNDYMIRSLRMHKRLRGTAIVSPRTDFYTLEKMNDDGIVGIRLQLARAEQLPDFRGDDYRMLFRRVRDLGWHVHIAIEGPALRPVLEALQESGVKTVIDHMGHPDPADPLACDGFHAMLEAVDRGHTWVKLSGGFRLSGTDTWRNPDSDLDSIAGFVAQELLTRVGTDRLLWGSDAPFVGYEQRVNYARVLESFHKWVPDPVARADISLTALKLYFA